MCIYTYVYTDYLIRGTRVLCTPRARPLRPGSGPAGLLRPSGPTRHLGSCPLGPSIVFSAPGPSFRWLFWAGLALAAKVHRLQSQTAQVLGPKIWGRILLRSHLLCCQSRPETGSGNPDREPAALLNNHGDAGVKVNNFGCTATEDGYGCCVVHSGHRGSYNRKR